MTTGARGGRPPHKKRRMTRYAIPHDAYARHQPYIEEILTLIDSQIHTHPDAQVLSDVWRAGTGVMLAEIIRVCGLSPDQIADYLARFCTALMEETTTAVQNTEKETDDATE